MKMTGMLNAITRTQSLYVSGTIWEIAAIHGTYRIRKCSRMLTNMATSSQGFAHGGICSNDPSSERALRALSISITTSTESERVEAVALPLAVKYAHGSLLKSEAPGLLHFEKSGL